MLFCFCDDEGKTESTLSQQVAAVLKKSVLHWVDSKKNKASNAPPDIFYDL